MTNVGLLLRDRQISHKLGRLIWTPGSQPLAIKLVQLMIVACAACGRPP